MNKKIHIFVKRANGWTYAFTTVKHKTCKEAVKSALTQYPKAQIKAVIGW